MAQDSNPEQVAERFGAAIESLDVDRLRAIYADDVVIWHGATGQAMGPDENCAMLAKLFALVDDFHYENIQRHPIPGGIVQQHVATGRFADGTPLPRLNACMVIKVRDGLITRIDEYFNADTFAPVWERMAAAG